MANHNPRTVARHNRQTQRPPEKGQGLAVGKAHPGPGGMELLRARYPLRALHHHRLYLAKRCAEWRAHHNVAIVVQADVDGTAALRAAHQAVPDDGPGGENGVQPIRVLDWQRKEGELGLDGL
jgi:hypothetical protein